VINTSTRYNRGRCQREDFRDTAISSQPYKSIARLFCLAILATHVFFLWNVRGRIARGDPDFTAYYTAGRMLRSGQAAQIYDPATEFKVQKEFTVNNEIRKGPLRYIHPPFETVLFLPLAFFSYRTAFVLWDLLNLGLVIAVCLISRTAQLAGADIRTWELVLALLAFFPVFVNFFQGQDAILLLLAVTLAFRAMHLRADFAAGCFLGAGLFRFHLVIPLVFILLLWGRGKVVAGFAAAAGGLFLISAAILGWKATFAYPTYLWLWISVPGVGRPPASLLPSLFGLVSGWPGLERIQWLLRLAAFVASAGLLVLVARLKHVVNDPRFFDLGFACAILVSVLVGYNTSTYDLALLVLPMFAVAQDLIHEQKGFRSLALPLLPLLVSPLWLLLGMRGQKFNLIAVLLLWWLFAVRKELLRRWPGGPQPEVVPPIG